MPYYNIGDGQEMLVGDDAMLVGAARRVAASRGHMAQAIANKRAATSPLVEERGPTNANELVLGLNGGSVAAAANVIATSRPQQVFRPERIIVPDAIAAQFDLSDFKIGTQSQFLASTVVPAETFKASAVGVKLKCSTAQINSDCSLTATNNSLVALTFKASLIGTSIS